MWQRCPICNGSGVEQNYITSSMYVQCSVCKGKKIISEINGLPPEAEKPKSNFESYDK